MTKLFWRNGRLAWTPVGAFCATGIALLAGDYVWRASSISGGVIAMICGAVALSSVVAILLDWARGSRSG